MPKREFLVFIMDSLSTLGGISSRAMFGGHGIYKDGVIFALIADNELYFKTDDRNKSDFAARSSHPFTYKKKDKNVSLSYWEVPVDILEDRETLIEWAKKAYLVARKGIT